MNAEALAALRELVALKDLKDREARLRQRRLVSIKRDPLAVAQVDQMRDDYNRRKPLAWHAARVALAKLKKDNGMTTDTRVAMEALYRECVTEGWLLRSNKIKVMDDAHAALATPAAQPVAPNNDDVICPRCCHQFRAIPVNVQRLMLDAGFEPPFAAKPTQERKPLTKVQITELAEQCGYDGAVPTVRLAYQGFRLDDFARAVEAKHGITAQPKEPTA